MFQMPNELEPQPLGPTAMDPAAPAMGLPDMDMGTDLDLGGDFEDVFGLLEAPDPFAQAGPLEDLGDLNQEPPIALQGRDLERFQFRLDMALSRAKIKMAPLHRQAQQDRDVYRTLEREQEYAGQPNITTPLSANKADGLLSIVVDAMEHRPLASFVPEGIGEPAETAAQVAPLCSALLEREINRGGSRERLVRETSKEAIQVGTGIVKLGMVRQPSGEWFTQAVGLVKFEHFYVDRVAVPNLKHCFSAYEERIPFYQLEEMAEEGLIDRDALEGIKELRSDSFKATAEEEAAEFREDTHAYQEETTVHKIHYAYMRFRPEASAHSEIYEAIWHDTYKKVLAVRLNPVRECYDHPPLGLARIGKQANYLFGRGIMRRMAPIQQMADNAINSHLALNDLAASPPFLYRAHSPFGKLMTSQRRIVPGVGIPTQNEPDRSDVKMLEFSNPGLSMQDISVAQQFADKATFTEEAIGTQSGARKTLGQFRVEMQRGTMRVRLDLGDLAYDMAMIFTMMWAMMIKFKVNAYGIIEIEEGGKFLADHDIHQEEITRIIDNMIIPLVEDGSLSLAQLVEFEEEFNKKLTEDMIPSARRSDLTIHLTGTKIIADKAAELEMLNELTPYILQGIELAKQDSYFNYHLRSIIEAMGFKDVEKRIPPDPGVVLDDPAQRQQLGQPLGDMISQSSNMV